MITTEVVNSNGWKVEGIDDTGVKKSLISDRWVLNDNIYESSYIRLVAANGSKIDVIGEVTLFVGTKKIPWRFLVVKKLIIKCNNR